MNTTLRETFARRAGDATPPDLDLTTLIDMGEKRLHRRSVATVLGSAAAVVVVIALALVGAALNGQEEHSNGPADERPHGDKETPIEPVRRLLYSDVVNPGPGDPGRTIHFGDRELRYGNGFVHLDVTDDGFVFTARGRAWFSDGGTPEEIGSLWCSASPKGEFSNFAHRSVMTANEGSSVAWFECARGHGMDLVVFDTASGREVVHRRIPICGTGSAAGCELFGLTSDRVYFNRGTYAGYPRPDYRFDLRTGELRPSSPQEYAEDVRSHPRGLVIGDSWQTGAATDGIGQLFKASGARLVPLSMSTEPAREVTGFDTATGKPVRLHLPAGYDGSTAGDFQLFEWLDDDTVALADGGGFSTRVILRCRLSDGRCDVAAGPGEGVRILPFMPLPG